MDGLSALQNWLDAIGAPQWSWFAKRLSANDTGSTGGHQAGFYLPRELALSVAPELADLVPNPRREIRFALVSHDQVSEPCLVYYNSRVTRLQPNGRNEFRVTGFGGRRSSLQDQESTGAILATAWNTSTGEVQAWLADALEEETAIEAVFGPIEPGTHVQRVVNAAGAATLVTAAPMGCEPALSTLPGPWAAAFPPGRELADEAIRRRPGVGETADRRLVERYRCEFGLFKVVEQAHTLPRITAGFKTVDDFLTVAQTVANRRKSRAGRSLELHLAKVFSEAGVHYDRGESTEDNRRPDFVFPSIADYRAGRPTRMLGVKTSVKERWRQVIDEAARIPDKHLFTLSEGVSVDQFNQMRGAGLTLVTPEENVKKFPLAIRSGLMTLANFVQLVK